LGIKPELYYKFNEKKNGSKNIHMRGERSIGPQRKKRKELCCNYCAQRGHFARNCPDIICWECGKKGHEKKSYFVKI
jgi:hypothetical protein